MEQHPQPLARSFDPHFQCGDTDAGDHRHVFIPQFFDVLQQECFPLVDVQSLQSTFQLFAPGRAFRRMIF